VQANRVECDPVGPAQCTARGGGVFVSGSGGFIDGNLIQDNVAQCFRVTCVAEGGGLFNQGDPMTLQGSHVIGNLARGALSARGGGIFNEGGQLSVIESSRVSDNLAGCVRRSECIAEGGGLYNNSGPASIVESTFSANALASRGLARGGGIFSIGGALFVERSTLRGNFILGNGSVFGGGMALAASHLALLNSTLSGNFVGCWGQQCSVASGGGLSFCCEGGQGPPVGSVAFTTFAGNFAACGSCVPGGGGILTDTTLSIAESIVANSSPLDCVSLGGPFAVGGAANLDTDGSCPGFSLPAANALLGPLALNGGPTETHALLAGSPAIDAASACFFGGDPVPVDQRNAPRPGGSACDLGAYEVGRVVGGSAPAPDPLGLPGIRSAANDTAKCRVVRVLRNGLRALERHGEFAPEAVEGVREAAERLRATADCRGKGPR
jgi:hypothetical protein